MTVVGLVSNSSIPVTWRALWCTTAHDLLSLFICLLLFVLAGTSCYCIQGITLTKVPFYVEKHYSGNQLWWTSSKIISLLLTTLLMFIFSMWRSLVNLYQLVLQLYRFDQICSYYSQLLWIFLATTNHIIDLVLEVWK